MSEVPQGSVLGPFLICINDLDDNITSNVLKFADDTKVFRKVYIDGDKQQLQNELDKLVKWSEKWQMLLHFWKCKCLHTGHGNLDINYDMGDIVLLTKLLTRLPSQTTSSRWQVDQEAIGLSRVQQCYHLRVARPYHIYVNSILKHIHTTSVNTII